MQEIAWNQGWITTEGFRSEVEAAGNSTYGAYLAEVLDSGGNSGAAG